MISYHVGNFSFIQSSPVTCASSTLRQEQAMMQYTVLRTTHYVLVHLAAVNEKHCTTTLGSNFMSPLTANPNTLPSTYFLEFCFEGTA